MHPAVAEWVAAHAPDGPVTVLDIGGRDINGTVRHLFHPDSVWTVIDLRPGPNVDVVADFTTYTHPTEVDVVVCCEVFEHTLVWPQLVAAAAKALKPGGRFLCTCAGPGRAPHSGVDGNEVKPGEHYANVSAQELAPVLALHFDEFDTNVAGLDLRAWATR